MPSKPSKTTKWFWTFDPGARADGGTGMALFRDGQPGPVLCRMVSSSMPSHEEKVDDILQQIHAILMGVTFSKIIPTKDLSAYVEKPQFFDSFKGHTAAKSESLFKLINFYSRLEELLKSMSINFFPVEISHWKGQLSKKQTRLRVEKICGKMQYPSDVIDAVGIGLYLKGLF